MRAKPLSMALILSVIWLCHSHVRALAEQPNLIPLHLEAIVNGTPSGLLIPAFRDQQGSISIARGELNEIGITTPIQGRPSDLINLDQNGIAYRYDEARQQITFMLQDQQRLPKNIDARGARAAMQATNDWGALFNYVAFASSSTSLKDWQLAPAVANLASDLRLFSPYGLVTQTGIIGNMPTYDLWREGQVGALRLESTYTFADPDTQRIYRAGDFITGSLEWTRPIRMGGAQVQRNFGLRPDLVTAALPSASGSAAVPSSVDVLVNGVRVMTQQVPEGPFRLTNLPVSSVNGDVQMVVRDATGRETRSTLNLFSSERMLAPGVFDYTLETGFARKFYALRSNDYDDTPLAFGSARYGFNDYATLQGHVEAGAGGGNLGIGVITQAGRFGTLNAAVSGSRFGGATGGQAYLSYMLMTSIGVNFAASTQRTMSNYNDLASATAVRWAQEARRLEIQANPNGLIPSNLVYTHPPKAIHRVTIGSKVPYLEGHASLAFAQITTDPRDFTYSPGTQSIARTISASYSRNIPYGGTFFASGFGNIAGRRDRGFFAGVSFPIGYDIQVGGGVQGLTDPVSHTSSAGANLYANKPVTSEIGSFGWSANLTRSETQIASGSASYRSSVGTARVTGFQQGNYASGTAQFEGAIALVGGQFGMGPRVQDAFAIVNAGAPDVIVRHENTVVGRTNRFGTLLLPTLRAYEANKIDIDPMSLPPDVVTSRTQEIIAPAFRSGVALDFARPGGAAPVVLVIKGPEGREIEPGSKGRVLESGETFLVGHDGRAYVVIDGAAHIEIDLGGATCRTKAEIQTSFKLNQEVSLTCG